MTKSNRMESAEELQLIHAAQRSDSRAVQRLIGAHMPLIAKLVGRFQVTSAMTDELIQAGCVGLMEAIQRYQDTRQTRLITYAVPWVLGEMRKSLRSVDLYGTVLSLESDCEEGSGRTLEETIGFDAIDLNSLDLRFAIEQLDEEEKRLLYLRFFRDKTQKDTALLLRKSQSQVCKLERRVLDKLHKQLV